MPVILTVCIRWGSEGGAENSVWCGNSGMFRGDPTEVRLVQGCVEPTLEGRVHIG